MSTSREQAAGAQSHSSIGKRATRRMQSRRKPRRIDCKHPLSAKSMAVNLAKLGQLLAPEIRGSKAVEAAWGNRFPQPRRARLSDLRCYYAVFRCSFCEICGKSAEKSKV